MTVPAASPSAEQAEFFEKHIRPVLVESCYKCHSGEAKKSKGGLFVDTPDALLKGGDTGPAIVPGNLDKSLFIKAIRYTDSELKMPPEKEGGKLSPEKIAAFETWVKMGAPDPRTGTAPVKGGINWEKSREHWSFSPIVKPTVPIVKDKAWVKSPVDSFVLAKLESKGMKPAELADKRTLLRRVSFDLTGLPPTPRETDEFLKDKSKDAFEKVVNRLLESPHYGERWGRYWLDVARYADTKGYLAGGEERRFPFSHTYRDYVIRAFNEDKPYDQFLIEQIAADKLQLGEDKRALAAMGFLTLGRRFLNKQDDIIDDRLDVVVRGTMALTIGCARCHDHKFDPVTMKDYYGLHGVFASSEEPAEKPLLGKLEDNAEYQDFLKQKAALEKKVEEFIAAEVAKFDAKLRSEVGEYLLAAREAKNLGSDTKFETFAGTRKLAPTALRNWMATLDRRAKQHDPVFAPWFALAALPEKEFAKQAKVLVAKFAANAEAAKPINAAVANALASASPASLKDVAAIYTKLFVEADKAKPVAGEQKEQATVRQLLYAEGAPTNPSDEEVRRLIGRRLREGTAKIRNQIEQLNWTHPGAPARGMALVDKPRTRNSNIYLRGNPATPGPEAPRQFLEIVAGSNRPQFKQGSGRLELARDIASKDNPLTARVFVNRIWGWHFGNALVRTPSDFGVRTEAPVHVDLINWLAATFIEQGWSVKKLHRAILLSDTYQQASIAAARFETMDADNQYLHRFNRRRLDFEAMRDSLLAASSKLDLAMGGLPVDITKEPFTGRRTVYGFIDRQNLPGMFRTFDFANPDTSSPQRFNTTVPQQALYMMNSPFVVEQARGLLNRAEIKTRATDAEKIQAIYQVLYQRAPESDEMKLAQNFLQQNGALQPRQSITPGWHYGYGWFDPLVSHTKDYKEMAFVDGKRASPTEKYPTGEPYYFVSVTPTGGHAGPTIQMASVRRWVSPTDGIIRVEGLLGHAYKEGDGVRGRIITSRGGKLGEWIVHNSKAKTEIGKIEVKLGETVDFVVDCIGGATHDSFTWAPKISLIGDYDTSLSKREWMADKEFAAKQKPAVTLTAWEKFAQVMLLANETVFVD